MYISKVVKYNANFSVGGSDSVYKHKHEQY